METAPQPKPRPQFLTILCILTFIGSTWGIISGLSKYNNADVAAEMSRQVIEQQKEKAMDKASTSGQKNFMKELFSGANEMMDTVKLKQDALFSIMSNVLTLLGAILMYRLRRTGFGFYVLGTLVYIAAPLIIFGFGNIFSIAMSVFLGIIGLIFVILYGLNLKHLR